MTAIIHGIILAFGLILPLGVQNVFVFNQGATQPTFYRALPVIVTAAISDTFLISSAVLGVSVLLFTVSWIRISLVALGFIFLVYMGYVTWKSEAHSTGEGAKALSPKKQIAFAASVSLLNPHAILDTVGVIGTSSIAYSGSDRFLFTIACIIVSWIWFIGLGFIGSKVGKLTQSKQFIYYLNKLSALIMWGTAVYLIYSSIR